MDCRYEKNQKHSKQSTCEYSFFKHGGSLRKFPIIHVQGKAKTYDPDPSVLTYIHSRSEEIRRKFDWYMIAIRVEVDIERIYVWKNRNLDEEPKIIRLSRMINKAVLDELKGYPHGVLAFIDERGYPFSIPVVFQQKNEKLVARKPKSLTHGFVKTKWISKVCSTIF